MKNIKRQKLPKHILVPDTNILWHKEKDMCASPEFTKFWADHSAIYEIDLLLPEVVRGELLYHHTTSAVKLLGRINSQFEELSSTANKSYHHLATESRVRHDVSKKFDNWVASIAADVVSTPIKEINQNIWGQVHIKGCMSQL